MQSVYQGVDWRNKANWGCNGGRNPLRTGSVEGVPMSLFELLFVKVKTRLLDNENHLAKAALAYDPWLSRSMVRPPPPRTRQDAVECALGCCAAVQCMRS